MIDTSKSFEVLKKVLGSESNFHVETSEQINKAIDHIFQLISDAYILYAHNSYSSSVFLSIAVIEEVAKLYVGMYVSSSAEYKKKDKLRDHKTKEIIGVNYTVSMSERIKDALGIDKLEEIYDITYSGKLKELREKAIYYECEGDKLITPADIIDKQFSRNILLFAIESFDDNLAGYTDHSIDILKKTVVIFDNIAKS